MGFYFAVWGIAAATCLVAGLGFLGFMKGRGYEPAGNWEGMVCLMFGLAVIWPVTIVVGLLAAIFCGAQWLGSRKARKLHNPTSN